MKPRSINIFLLEGDPNGIRVAQVSMSTIQAIAFRRNQLRKVRDSFPEIARPGVYVLLGCDDVDPDRMVAYIGESEAVGDRLQFHTSSEKHRDTKAFWSDTIVLVSKDENLTKSHARYGECRLIAEAGRNPRWTLGNSQRAGEDGKLPLPDRAAMEEFIDQTKTLVGALGCDLFRAVLGGLPGERSPEPEGQEETQGAVFASRGQGFEAEMAISPSGEFIIRRGSRARLRTTPTVPRGTMALRESLIEKGVLREDNGTLIFCSDYTFSSVSAAAAAVIGASANGRTLWHLPDGRTYAEWEGEENADTSAPGQMQEI